MNRSTQLKLQSSRYLPFQSCMHHPYAAFLNGTGLTIKFLRLEWYTTALNRTILNWSTKWARLLRLSFDGGVYACLLLVPISFVFLVYAVVQAFHHGDTDPSGLTTTTNIRPVEVEILVPGITLPKDELGYYIITLLVCTVFHELGHAIASYLEDVPLNGFGVRVLFIIPMAYADLSTEALDRIKNWRKLRIFCAGVWHNLLLGALSYLVFMQLPLILSPLFRTSAGIYILDVAKDSPIRGPRGLQAGDVIVQINRVKVTNSDAYYDALIEALRDKPKYCVTSDYVHTHDESKKIETVAGLIECCDRAATENLCFEHFIVNGILEMPPFMCLHVRRAIESSGGLCDDQDNCNPGYYCIKPLLDNRTTILQISRARGEDVLYLGSPGDVYKTAKWSPFVPKTRLISPRLAENLTLLFKYFTVFSFGLAFVNILPCYGFDGQYIVRIIVHQVLSKVVRKRRNRDAISMAITIFGSFLLCLLVLDFLKHNLVKSF